MVAVLEVAVFIPNSVFLYMSPLAGAVDAYGSVTLWHTLWGELLMAQTPLQAEDGGKLMVQFLGVL